MHDVRGCVGQPRTLVAVDAAYVIGDPLRLDTGTGGGPGRDCHLTTGRTLPGSQVPDVQLHPPEGRQVAVRPAGSSCGRSLPPGPAGKQQATDRDLKTEREGPVQQHARRHTS